MNPQLPPGYAPYPPIEWMLIMFGCAFAFGMVYNQFFKKFIRSSAFAVVIGVCVTGIIVYAFFWHYTLRVEQTLLIMLVAFVGSGIPMIYGEYSREEKKSHHRRVPTYCRQLLGKIGLEVQAVIADIEQTTSKNITPAALLRWSNRLHEVKGMTQVQE